ncbi:capsular polysaccharide export protein [Primorskyibacter sedentarius]|uniref:Capsular polysaccharide export protein n=1 Tax=Primorskyibacter sedentarius TaxID=745311 RepID=A0A4R3JLP5_9RHOB|nr:capsular polysaccharide biosynthesis protein [Primorskyibacter sedentarius]TCS67253.1 capsular polysaccharide export protein [Primorskyibacter sedentarius]
MTELRSAGERSSRRFYVYNGGFLTQARLRRILALSGYRVSLGLPGRGDPVGVWGRSPTAHRGEAVAARRAASLVRVEDAFLRSVRTGRDGDPPLGLLIDHSGVHFDPSTICDLERLLLDHPLEDAALLARAEAGIARLIRADLSKYNAFDPALPAPAPGYVLVVDQTRGDASVTASGGDRARFVEMLDAARRENPGRRILIKTHPETRAGHRPGYFQPEDAGGDVAFQDAPVSPWALLKGAEAVYTLSSQMGFEAILAGHAPRVFGQPFYAGWGLSVDERPLARRGRALRPAQLFAAAMILYPRWYDPCRDRLCSFEEAVDLLEAQVRAFRDDRRGWVAEGMRLWKRAPLQRFFGTQRRVLFDDKTPEDTARAQDRRHMVWAGKASPGSGAVRVEDGFLRSRGLGAELIPPLSLVCDTRGIYYDPSRPSDLEQLIAASPDLPADQIHRAERLIAAITAGGLSKYNLPSGLPDLPPGRRVLVPGQVEDDASILTGCGALRSNQALLQAAREANPDAVLLYKPHPDVEAGLRQGAVPDAARVADRVLEHVDMGGLLGEVEEVWTLTSLTGFEALLRGVRVVTLGAPFYAGWGLTSDLGEVPGRRRARVSLPGLVHAALIAYPRYRDPVSGLPCPVEVVVERLAKGEVPRPGPFNRSLSKLQGLFASRAHLWRK